MKRSTILLTACVFMMGTVAAPSVSYAAGVTDFLNHEHINEAPSENQNSIDDTDQSYSGYTEDVLYQEETAPEPALKIDTTWFNYEKPAKTYKITTEAQLLGLASLVNENQTESWKPSRLENFEGVTFILMDDIQLSDKWTPIGTGSASYFSGTFDGNNHTISNMIIDSNGEYIGLFGFLKGQVKNLNVTGEIKSGTDNTGGIAGQLEDEGKIINCTSAVTITAKDKTGGITGYNNGGKIERCINKGNISGTYKVGGVVGENWAGIIEQCGNTGDVTSTQRGVATYGTGGVAGRSVSADSVVTESYNTGKIISNTEATGGVVGYTNAAGASVTSCYNNGEIIIKGNQKEAIKSWVGGVVGIVGCKGITIHSCYSSKGVTGADITGGVIGRYIDDPNDITENKITRNYYVSEFFDAGIGQTEENKKISDAAMGVSAGGLSKMATSLGAAYINDSSGRYGNYGFPVLEWQSPVSEDERSYLSILSKDVQIGFDKYLIETAADTETGWAMLSFLDPNSYITNAASQYHAEKMEEEEQNEE